MVQSENARAYLKRRIAEHDLGVEDGSSMTPDEIAIATLLLDVDERLSRILDKLETRCCPWLDSLIQAVQANKAAMALIFGAIFSIIASVLDIIIRHIK